MNDNRNNSSSNAGVGFCGLLALVFIVLKLTHVIDWSWLWVLAPIWIPAAIAAVILLVIVAAAAAAEVKLQMEFKAIDAEAAKYGLKRWAGEGNGSLKQRIAIERAKEGVHE